MYNNMMLETKSSLDMQNLDLIFNTLEITEDKPNSNAKKSNSINHDVTLLFNGLFDEIGSQLLK